MGGSNFVLQWPSDSGKVTVPYDAATGIVKIAAAAGSVVKAAASGQVTTVAADRIEIASGAYLLVYSNLRKITLTVGQSVTAGGAIGESVGPDISLAVRQTIDPTPLLPSTPIPAPAPTPGPSKDKLYLSPIQSGVRVREKPVDGNPLTQVGTTDVLEVIEPIDAARKKIGVSGEWINIRTQTGLTGFTAAQFLQEYTGPFPIPAPMPALTGITGMNLDMHNPLGHPSADRLKGIGWIRVKFNVSYNPTNNTYGNTDVNATFNRVRPFLQPYVAAGIKVLMVFTHQLYGEGAGYNWPTMDSGKWNDLIPKYADYAKRTAALFAGTGLVSCYQVWNEQDTPPAIARAAVPIPAKDYGNMLTQTIRAIRSVDSKTPIITGGHTTGPDSGSAYARATLAAMPADIRPDGIASHPYGRGVSGHKFSNFGPLDEEIRKYSTVLPGKPLWFTEWGVLDRQGDNSIIGDVTSYATGFINVIKSQYPTQVAAAIWYAWADGMDNGYGLVGANDQPKQPLYQKFITL